MQTKLIIQQLALAYIYGKFEVNEKSVLPIHDALGMHCLCTTQEYPNWKI
jgi:hypothetical protein